jgi:hypothetical protein
MSTSWWQSEKSLFCAERVNRVCWPRKICPTLSSPQPCRTACWNLCRSILTSSRLFQVHEGRQRLRRRNSDRILGACLPSAIRALTPGRLGGIQLKLLLPVPLAPSRTWRSSFPVLKRLRETHGIQDCAKRLCPDRIRNYAQSNSLALGFNPSGNRHHTH